MKKLTPIKAIREKCLDCSGNQYKEIRNCDVEDCPLYSYRLGKRPGKADKNGDSDEKLASKLG